MKDFAMPYQVQLELVTAKQWSSLTFRDDFIIGVEQAESSDGVEFQLTFIDFLGVGFVCVGANGFPFISYQGGALHFEVHDNSS
jgi:hypothetical protein